MKPCKNCQYRSIDDPNYCCIYIHGDIPLSEPVKIDGEAFDDEPIPEEELPEECIGISGAIYDMRSVLNGLDEVGLTVAMVNHAAALLDLLMGVLYMAVIQNESGDGELEE